MDRLISTPETKNTIHPPLMISQQHMQQARQSQQQQQEFDKDSVFEQVKKTKYRLKILTPFHIKHTRTGINKFNYTMIHNSKTLFPQQGETRDFLYFLRRIRYDHRQCPQNEGVKIPMLRIYHE